MKNFTQELIIKFLYFYIPLDMVNGVLINNNFLSISPIFKVLTLFLILFYLSKKKQNFFSLSLLISILMLYIAKDLLFFNLNQSIYNLDWLIKFISIVIYYLFFSNLIYLKQEKYIYRFFKISFIFLIINFTLAFFGFGYSMYSGDIGKKGFIFAGNELGALFVITSSMIQMHLIKQNRYVLFLIISFISIFIGAILSSKVAIFSSIILTLAFSLIKLFEDFKGFKLKKKNFKFAIFILFFTPLISVVFAAYLLFVSNLIERLLHFYDKLDLITLIFSHRNVWTVEAINVFNNKYTFFEMLFGTGKNWFIFISNEKMVEIDLIDFLMTYGVFGVLITYGFLIYLLVKLLKNKNNPYRIYLLFIFFLIIGISLTGGHILNSGIAAAQIGAVLALINYKKDVLYAIT